MPDQGSSTATHLSIGEVLALVLEEFPDVTISKIRFLESQGLIDPERTPSGYRKFYEEDIELLRCILREQRENYLPLRVIKDRLDSGEIDPTNEQPRPAGIKNVTFPDEIDDEADDEAADIAAPAAGDDTATADARSESSSSARRDHPASGDGAAGGSGSGPESGATGGSAAASFFAPGGSEAPKAVATDERADSAPAREPLPVPPGGLDADEICSLTSLTASQLADLVSYGVVVAADGSGSRFDDRALEIATIAKRMLDAGLDARHLRGWRVAVEREAGLFEQLISPLLRQRNPEAQEQALVNLRDLERLGAELHGALMRDALHPHLDT